MPPTNKTLFDRSLTASVHTELPPEEALQAMMRLPLQNMFTPWLFLTGAKNVTYRGEGWDQVGCERRIHQLDGGGSDEKIVRLEPGRRFTYQLDNFDKGFALVSKAVDDDWVFTQEGTGSRIDWTWTFQSSRLQYLLTYPIQLVWQHYMRRVLPVGAAQLTVS